MSVVQDLHSRFSDTGDTRGRIVARFREAWLDGQRPVLDDYLPLHDADRHALLPELVRVEIACRQNAGESPRVESYLLRYPELGDGARLTDPPLEEKKTVIDGSQRTPPPERERPLLPGYEVLEEIGRGGMGVVYKARQVGLNRVVALKMILAGAQAAGVDRDRFRAEAEAVARLQHPNIVQVYEVGEHQGRPYFSFEYCAGGSLEDRLAGRPLPPRDAAELVEVLARAMHHAHQQGIVHRDLKPANVLLAPASGRDSELPRPEAGANGTPKITDFGLAKQLDQPHSHTHTGTVLGTPPYMAPEQARGRNREIGPATDVYALGAILFECLTGRPPFDGDSVAATLHQVLHDDPTPPRRLQPRCPRDLETICLKCLHKDPRQRYATARELADDLLHFRAGKPVAARPVPVWERGRRWARRHPAGALAIVTGLAAVAALVGAILWHDVQLEAAVEAARASEKVALERAAIARARAEAQELLAEARAAFAERRWEDACLKAERALAALDDRPELAALTVQAATLLRDARQHQEALARHEKFRELRDDALFHGLVFAGVDPGDSLEQTRQSARDALRLYGVDQDFTGPLRVDTPLLPSQRRDEVASGCYELLLVLAGTLTQPRPGETEAARQERLDEAMQVLDQAARLGLPATKAYHLRRARLLELQGRDAEAVAERQAARTLEPVNAIDHFLAGDERRSHGDLVGAARAFEAALNCEPGHFWAQYGLACCHLRLGRLAEAKAGLTACVGRQPGFSWLYPLRGLVHTELGDFASADADFTQALRLAPQPTTRYAMHANRGVLRFRQAQAVEPPPGLDRAALIEPLLRPTLAVLRAAQQEYLTQAVADLREAIELRPRDPQAHASLAQVWARLGRPAEARKEFDTAVALAPRVPELYRSRAEFLVQRQDVRGALRDLRQAAALDDRPHDHVQIGRLLQQQGDSESAAAEYAAALRLQPDHPAALRLRAVALLELRRYDEAAASLDRFLEIVNRPGQITEPPAAVADGHRLRGLTRAQLGDYAGALHDHTRALDIQPDAVTHVYRGWLYLVQNAAEAARRDFEAAVQLDPSRGEAFVGRAQARQKLGQVREAVEDAETALKLGLATPRLLLNAAVVFAQAGGDGDGRTRTPMDLRRAWLQKSLSLVTAALAEVPVEQRGRFWQEHIVTDPGLEPLRRLAEFHQIAPKRDR